MRIRYLVVVTVAVVGCAGIPSDESGSDGGSAGGGSARSGGGAGGGNETGGGGGTTGSGGGGGNGGAAGGAQASRDDLYTAGTRLKVRSLVGTDGSRQQVGLWDSQRKEACYFLLASDGRMRCIPLQTAIPWPSQYSDTQCSNRVWFSTYYYQCGNYPYGYALESERACSTEYVIYTLTPTSPSAIWQSLTLPDGGTTCSKTSSAPDGGYQFAYSGVPLAPSSFVAADYVTE